MNKGTGVVELKRRLSGSIEWSITGNQSVEINDVFCSANG
ncbi:hypothetical protein EC960497_A0057 [Escherichia coli 96.0497]|nr:hypothetical protein ECSTECB2F1_0150 [Escherichia coli O91:H21 str. B2F1]EIH35620.1 hypothetical protein EC960497_A0057 [Escherichia coli 96.0497]